jgi:hypothetical protein
MKRAVLLVALCVMSALAACGSGGVAPRLCSPVPAPSTSAFSSEFKGGGDRTIDVFLKDSVTTAQRDAMAGRIAAMPEVEVYAFVTKAQALQQFQKMLLQGPYKEMLGKQSRLALAWLWANPVPASFRVIVKDVSQVRTVASRFYSDPTVDNSHSTHGVVARYLMTH